MADVKQTYTKAGRAIYRHPDGHTEVTVAWGPGYPPVTPPIDPDTQRPYKLAPGSDDPTANLEDLPAE
jgi:hypothetical protein